MDKREILILYLNANEEDQITVETILKIAQQASELPE